MAINVPAIALARSVVAPDNREVLWEDTSNMNLPFYERVKSYDSNSGQWRMVTQLPLELLNELRKVDGDGSGLDANFLQGRTVNDIIQLAKDGSFTLPNGFIFIGNTLGNATPRAVSGDATLNNIGTLSLIASGVTAGTYNLASLTIDAKGRITSASSYTITVNDIPELPQSKITNLTTDLSARELLANKENSVINTSTTKYPTVNLLKIGLDTKEPTITAGTTGQYWRGDKTFQTLDKTAVGLSNVDNTSDADKPISSATQTALNAKLSNVVEDTTPQLGGDLDLNNNDINGTGNVDITGNVIADIVQLRGGTGTQGEMSWSTDEETVKLIMDGTTLYMGQDTFVHVRNNTASIITKGTAVYATGTLGASGRITVAPMIANGTIPGRLFIGLAAEDIAIGADGQVCSYGKIRGINTTAYNDGDVLWISPTVAGQLTATEPTAPNLKIATAFVIHDATNGTLMVRAEQGNDLHSDQRVQVSGLANNDVLTWNNSNQRWQNAQPTSSNIYTANGIIGSNRVATLTDTLSFSGGRVSFDTTTNGILLPRLTTVQMNGISSPATNLLVYNTDLNGLYRYNGSAWVALSVGYGIIGVYSGTGNGTPVFFANLQSALETCKGSGQYYTVKLYSNITVTSSIQIEYTGSGLGNDYKFRELTIDFNGFSITNSQTDTSDVFDIRLSNSASVYQEIKFLNGDVIRTNGTGTHNALRADTVGRFGTIQMNNMFWYCQNSIACSVALNNTSTQIGINKVCDLGDSTFVSQTSTAFVSTNSKIRNFNAIAHGSTFAISCASGEIQSFSVENTSTGIALAIGGTAICKNFDALSNSGTAVNITAGTLYNFTFNSVSGIGLNATTGTCNIDKFSGNTGNNYGVYVLGQGVNISNGKVYNNSALDAVYLANFGTAHNIEGFNNGSGVGLLIGANQVARNEASNCKGFSAGGSGGILSVPDAVATINVSNCLFSSDLNSNSGHALIINSSTGTIRLTNTHLKVRSSGANAINATSPVTIRARFCTHNEVATTPFNSNVTVIQSKSIPDEGIPNVTTAQMNAIVSPATNLLVYNTDLNGLYRYNGSSWVALSSGYGIIGVYSGSGNGTPTFFADLQSALETCKASGGYFTVKLYSNITITSAIEIDYANTGVGNAYLFRQLTIDFNGFSVTNAQANTSNAFTINLSNSISVYQEVRFVNGNVFRTNGTGTHFGLFVDGYGTIQMEKMYWFCQNHITARIHTQISTANQSNKITDLGGSTFISQTHTALGQNDNTVGAQNIRNFNAISYGAQPTVRAIEGVLSDFTSENTSTGIALNLEATAKAERFYAKSNSGNSVNISGGLVRSFRAISVTGRAVNISTSGNRCDVDDFYSETGNNYALFADNDARITNGKCVNNGATDCVRLFVFNSATNIEATNLGSGVGMNILNLFGGRTEVVNCTAISFGGIGGIVDAQSGQICHVDNCNFVSDWNNAGGHALRVTTATGGTIKLTKCNLKVKNASANAINATSAVTVNSRYCTHNEVATTPINANVTIVSSGIIS